MKVFMIGGTGLLGSEAARIFIERGHQVKSVALPPLPKGAPIPKEMELVFANIIEKTDDEIKEMMQGCDCFVFAAGVDERIEFPPPVYDAYYKYNIAPVKRLLGLAKEVGIKHSVILGSYFSYLCKQRPDLHMYETHPYVRSRIDQENVAFSFADDNFDVSVLELPYIFGTQPGRKPVWVVILEKLKSMDKLPCTFYSKGGTAMLTVRQVGECIVGAAERNKGANAYPCCTCNMTWDEFLKIVYDARGMGKNRKIVGVPAWSFAIAGKFLEAGFKKRNVETGIKTDKLARIMDMNLYMDPSIAFNKLGVTEDDIHAAIFDSIKLSVDAMEGRQQLLDQKGE